MCPAAWIGLSRYHTTIRSRYHAVGRIIDVAMRRHQPCLDGWTARRSPTAVSRNRRLAVLLEHEIEAVSDQSLHCRVLLGSKHAHLLRALGREETGELALVA